MFKNRTQTPTQNINLAVLQNSFNIDINTIGSNHIIVGPSRVFPGRLSVSRSFGDVEAKIANLGGMHGVIVPTPDIISFKIDSEVDFLVLGCKLYLTKR
jgi:serine/threonine protein phosphatase PrpC